MSRGLNVHPIDGIMTSQWYDYHPATICGIFNDLRTGLLVKS